MTNNITTIWKIDKKETKQNKNNRQKDIANIWRTLLIFQLFNVNICNMIYPIFKQVLQHLLSKSITILFAIYRENQSQFFFSVCCQQLSILLIVTFSKKIIASFIVKIIPTYLRIMFIALSLAPLPRCHVMASIWLNDLVVWI